ncbi:hypothetical protein [Paenibacillus xylanivorans]|uniref:Uncharacterized protein n=1 Tax=Paenibacillus xylanivorans TaxID=1705561 RepID=A0A0N0C3W5_9BACL|nr:hypothetical protein [Paenibacillus xylanivorans]KOY14924.1 hypothetical protein AMS66_19370 [Paenibacillus xylanivorans]
MTYSQRLTHGSSSDIIYLEHQIGVAEDELAKAEEEQRAHEADLNQLRTSPAYSTSVPNISNEQKLVDQLNKVQSMIKTIRARLKNLQDDLGKLED